MPGSLDDAHLAVFEDALEVQLDTLQLHRRDPSLHLANLELACYEREYAPTEERAIARRRHLAAWPDAVDAAIASLDRLSAPVAAALLGAVRGLAAGLHPGHGNRRSRSRGSGQGRGPGSGRGAGAPGGAPDEDAPDGAPAPGAPAADPPAPDPLVTDALAAHARLVAHVARAARGGDPGFALGGGALALLMGSQEGVRVDLGRLAERAEAERDRMRELLAEACRALDPRRTPAELVPELLADHPGADGVVPEAARLAGELLAFTRERGLAPHTDGVCRVGPAPESRRWSTAMMTWAAPGEPDAPSWYHVTPPDPSWPAAEAEEWLAVLSRTTLPAVTAHEVAPGHFAHARSLRRAATPVRRTLFSPAFCEGWAHYAEEVCLEEGFRAGDARFAAGVALEGLVRATRLACAIGLHTGAMDVGEAVRRFAADAHLPRTAAAAEARRGTADPCYGRYTWGKLEVRALRERTRSAAGARFTLRGFHAALLERGSPPLGLLPAGALRLP
ncbi:DUF885 domain-containing protein [Streptacidiphilus sp. ASG 303]|uniref:DUF885 family protein n=1 Tax=Streptacidiphilus sp. ASG 303 TaxID=2896847 RepID=UPI001E32A0BA|nr:DUF885 family protein [Streptacidiphilus sp. ASG 303]MCD0483034.1 DUF885 domain-containing protein [Streptacidiphilus sp. ASG 303]